MIEQDGFTLRCDNRSRDHKGGERDLGTLHVAAKTERTAVLKARARGWMADRHDPPNQRRAEEQGPHEEAGALSHVQMAGARMSGDRDTKPENRTHPDAIPFLSRKVRRFDAELDEDAELERLAYLKDEGRLRRAW